MFYKEWLRPVNTLADDPEEERKLMFGMIFSLKDLAQKLSPTVGLEGIHTVKTNSFTLHHFQSATGLTFILNSDPEVSGNHQSKQICFNIMSKSMIIFVDLYQSLQHIYSQLFVECVVRNPLYRYNPNEACQCPLFERKLEEYVKALAAFQ